MKILLPILFVIIFILFMGIIFWAIYSSTNGHEQAHVQINKFYGMKSSYTINVGWDGISGVTTPDGNDLFYDNDARDMAYLAHGINEAIGYQLRPFFIGIMVFLMFITIILFLNTLGGNSNGKSFNRRKTVQGEGSHSDGVQLPSA